MGHINKLITALFTLGFVTVGVTTANQWEWQYGTHRNTPNVQEKHEIHGRQDNVLNQYRYRAGQPQAHHGAKEGCQKTCDSIHECPEDSAGSPTHDYYGNDYQNGEVYGKSSQWQRQSGIQAAGQAVAYIANQNLYNLICSTYGGDITLFCQEYCTDLTTPVSGPQGGAGYGENYGSPYQGGNQGTRYGEAKGYEAGYGSHNRHRYGEAKGGEAGYGYQHRYGEAKDGEAGYGYQHRYGEAKGGEAGYGYQHRYGEAKGYEAGYGYQHRYGEAKGGDIHDCFDCEKFTDYCPTCKKVHKGFEKVVEKCHDCKEKFTDCFDCEKLTDRCKKEFSHECNRDKENHKGEPKHGTPPQYGQTPFPGGKELIIKNTQQACKLICNFGIPIDCSVTPDQLLNRGNTTTGGRGVLVLWIEY